MAIGFTVLRGAICGASLLAPHTSAAKPPDKTPELKTPAPKTPAPKIPAETLQGSPWLALPGHGQNHLDLTASDPAREDIIVLAPPPKHWQSARPDIQQYKPGIGPEASAFFDGTLLCGPATYTTYAGQPMSAVEQAVADMASMHRLCQ